jgi:hypothetical protein
MIYFIIYISGIITTLSLIGFFYQFNKSTDKDKVIDSLKTKVSTLTGQVTGLVEKINKQKLSIESDKRIATLTWGGWHKADEPNKTWSVTFELREIALSEDETRSKFEVLSAVSENMKNDSWGTQEYGDYFIKKTGGGWLDTKNPQFNSMKLTWVTTISKSEARQKKIDELLKPDKNE